MHLLALLLAAASVSADLEQARDRQDRPALERIAHERGATAASKANNADAQYNFAVAQSYLSEVALELKDKAGAKDAAEAGIRAAEKSVALKPNVAENHRILGTLCGQVIPANVLAGLRYGKCAQQSINKAIELDAKSSLAYVSRGVGNYYLPASFGGGVELAIQDFRKAIQLNPRQADAHLWLGIALRKSSKNAEARQAFTKALEISPNRVWAKQQLEKTPAQ
jgi:tetratricopeptide (TPR) repeat protein